MSSEKIIDDAIQAIVDGVYDTLKREAAKLSYDMTKTARVSAVLPDNYYQIEMDGNIYNVPSHTFVSLNVGDIVDITIPQNNYSKLYIDGLSSSNPDKQERDLEALTEPFRKALTIDIDTNCIVIPCNADGVPEARVDVVVHSFGTRGGEETSDYTISLEGSYTGIQATVNNATKTITFSIPERTITEKIAIENLNMYTLTFKDNNTGWVVTKIVNVNGIYKGQTGDDGVTQYVHIAYSAYANGRDFTSEPNLTVHKYMGVATTTSSTFPTRADSFKWSLIQGADGQTYYTWIKYANSANPTSADLSDSPDGMSYIGIASNKELPEEESTDSTNPSQYKWSRLQGHTGDPGKDGADGADGKTYYTWIKYSQYASPTSNQMSDSPDGMSYIGIAANMESSVESNNPSDYAWALIKGSDGADGSPGADGQDGADAITYWMVVSAASIKKSVEGAFTPSSITLTGKSKIGSSSPSDYSCRFKIERTTNGTYWSTVYTSSSNESSKSYTIISNTVALRVSMYAADGTTLLLDQKIIPIVNDGTPGQDGQDGQDGQTYYTWIKYSNYASPTSAQMSDSPSGMTYIGIAPGQTTATESTNPGDYSWTRFRGEDGADGADGTPGTDGQDAVTYWMVVSAASIKRSVSGTYTPSSISLTGKSKVGDSSPSDYACRFKIERTTDGNTWSSVSTSSSNQTTITYTVSSNTIALRCSMYAAGGTTLLLDQKIIPVVNDGEPGQDGADGTDGKDGQTYYTWIKYSNYASPTSSQMSDSPSGMTYIGIATNKTSATESTTPGDYSWTRFRGEDGTDGSPGTDGQDGQDGADATTYWMITSAAAIRRSKAGSLSPSSITLLAQSQTGINSPTSCLVNFKIETTTDGTNWTSRATSGNQSSSTYNLPTSNTIVSVRCSMYKTINGAEVLLDQRIIPIVDDGTDGTDSTSYWMICSANSIKKDVYGVYSPQAITLTGMSKTGNAEPAPYAGFFVVYYTNDGVNWLPQDGYYNTEAAETYSYTVSGVPLGLKCQMFLDVDRTILLDEHNVAIVSDGTESYMHIKYSAYSNGYTTTGEPAMTDRPVMETADTQEASRYIGLATTSSALAPEEPYSYKWSVFNIKEDITASFIRDRLNTASAEQGVTHYVLDASALSIYGAAFKMYASDGSKEIFGIDSNGSLVLGNPVNDQKLKMTSDGMHFVISQEGATDLDLAYFEDDEFYITNGIIKNRLDLGNFSFIPRDNGNMSLIKTKEV